MGKTQINVEQFVSGRNRRDNSSSSSFDSFGRNLEKVTWLRLIHDGRVFLSVSQIAHRNSQFRNVYLAKSIIIVCSNKVKSSRSFFILSIMKCFLYDTLQMRNQYLGHQL